MLSQRYFVVTYYLLRIYSLLKNNTFPLLKNDKAFSDASNTKLYSLLNAYFKTKKTAVKEQLKNFSKEELDAILPGFYDKANNL